ncbi:MAG: hemerythrin domain-containing protein [Muribaculaceae bacterium]|nr:hemerythrin domain-containing protein [Muribaculaceae bacterium]
MIKNREYIPDDKMISLISNDYRILQVLSRFGIPLGFNEKTVREVCEDAGVDCNTFLTVVNFLNSDDLLTPDVSQLSISSLIHFLKQSHTYFLDFYLPSIRRKLLDGITLKESDVSFLIIKLFDEYLESIKEHMKEEEAHLFKQIETLPENGGDDDLLFPVYSRHHQEVGAKLRELKNIIIKYSPADSSANLLNAALYDIYRCEEELESHCKIEDRLLLPALRLS